MAKTKEELAGKLIFLADVKSPPTDADYLGIMDAASSPVTLKKLSLGTLKTLMGTGTGSSANFLRGDNTWTDTITGRLKVEGELRSGQTWAATFTQINDAGGISAGDTSVILSSVSGLPTVGTILIDNEAISYSGISGNTVQNLVRGQFGTTAATHADSSYVTNLLINVAASSSLPRFAITSNGIIMLGTLDPSSAISGGMAFKISSSGQTMGFNPSGWFEMSDGIRTLLWGLHATQGGFFGTYTSHSLTFRTANVAVASIDTSGHLDLLTGDLKHAGTKVVGARGAALTAPNAGTVNSGDATTDAVINNIRTRLNELEARLTPGAGHGLIS